MQGMGSPVTTMFVTDAIAPCLPLGPLLALACVAAVSATRARRGLRALLAEPPRPSRRHLVLALVTALGVALRFLFVPALHRVYTDEHFYMQAAAAILRGHGWGVDPLYEKLYGWPAILALPFGLFGSSSAVALATSRLVGALTVPTAYWVARRLGIKIGAALMAALLLAIWPAHVLWSTSAETNAAAALAVLGLVGAWRTPAAGADRGDWLLLGALSALTCAIRVEGAAVVALLAACSARRRDLRAVAAMAVGVAVALPNLYQGLALQLHTNLPLIQRGDLLEIAWAPLRALLGSPGHPAWLAGLALAGAWWARRHAPDAPLGLLSAWLLVGLFVLVVGGGGALASVERLLIVPSLPLLFLAGLAVTGLPSLLPDRLALARPLAVVIIVSLVTASAGLTLADRRTPSDGYRLQMIVPGLVSAHLPKACTLVANLPEMYTAETGRPVRAAADYLAHDGERDTGCHCFIWDLSCFEWRAAGMAERCARLRARAAGPPLFTRRIVKDHGVHRPPEVRETSLFRLGPVQDGRGGSATAAPAQ